MKIKYVQLESDAFLTDLDYIRFTPAERGLYCSLIFFLASNDGKCEFDPAALSRLCNCDNVQQFEQFWHTIAKKFQVRNGVIKHKRVTKELRKAKKMLQARRKAGQKGARVTWQNLIRAVGDAVRHGQAHDQAKRRKGNVIEKESKDNNSNTNSNNLSCSSSNPVRLPANAHIQALNFHQALISIIPPRSRSDRTCFHNVTQWLAEGTACGRFDNDTFTRVLDFAKEARAGQKPAAVFMALLKKELGYRHG
jgi:uncharacterized protein YdaU (DUF1376 family)